MLILETFLISHFPIRPSLFKSLWAATITTKPSLDATSRAPFLCTAVAKEGLGSKARDLLSSSHLPTLLLVNNLAKTAFNQNNSFLSKYLLCSIRVETMDESLLSFLNDTNFATPFPWIHSNPLPQPEDFLIDELLVNGSWDRRDQGQEQDLTDSNAGPDGQMLVTDLNNWFS